MTGVRRPPVRAAASVPAIPPLARLAAITTTRMTWSARDLRSSASTPPAGVGSPVSVLLTGDGRISQRVKTDIPNEAASTPNAPVDAPVAATRAPPATGPSSEPAWTAAVDSAFPAASCSPSSSDGMIA
jgi:hypothetical protein